MGYPVRGSSALRPERSLGANLSASWRIVADIEATLALFRNELWDLIDTGLAEVLAGEQQFRYLNRSRARTQGIESGLSARLGSWLMLEVTYTFTDTRDLARERPLSGRARHRGTGRVLVGGAEHDWTLSTRAQLVGKRHYFDVSDASAAGAALAAPLHVVIDARAGDRAGRQVDLFASAENLAGAHPRNTPLRPTTIYAGLNLSY